MGTSASRIVLISLGPWALLAPRQTMFRFSHLRCSRSSTSALHRHLSPKVLPAACRAFRIGPESPMLLPATCRAFRPQAPPPRRTPQHMTRTVGRQAGGSDRTEYVRYGRVLVPYQPTPATGGGSLATGGGDLDTIGVGGSLATGGGHPSTVGIGSLQNKKNMLGQL